jgi:8-oxo-dGTP diphosphatase
MGRKPSRRVGRGRQRAPSHVTVAVVLQVRDAVCHVLLWQRAQPPFRGRCQLSSAYLWLVPSDADPRLPDDTAWHPFDRLPSLAFDHASIVAAGRERLRAKLSYTNVGFALAPEEFTLSDLREIYSAALGYEVSATNLHRVLVRRDVIEPTGGRRASGPTGGRPGALFRFAARQLAITDQFAVLRPPGPQRAAAS